MEEGGSGCFPPEPHRYKLKRREINIQSSLCTFTILLDGFLKRTGALQAFFRLICHQVRAQISHGAESGHLILQDLESNLLFLQFQLEGLVIPGGRGEEG